jgi:PepSY-associated TM region
MRMAKIANGLWRTLIVTHRYLGVAVGILMVMWFVSGVVMMYVGFPRVTGERIRALVPISWQACCRFGERLIADDQQVLHAQIENLADTPTMRLRSPGKPDTAVDLAQGSITRIDADQAQAIALDAAPRVIGQAAALVFTEQAQTDQWTVGRLVRDRPLFRFVFDDPERTNIYVSGVAGQVVHWTTATQRFWNWLGTIPHWLYFADLRSNVALWSQIVIWTSIVGTFLTVIGLYLGISQFKLQAGKSVSPYRGWFYWHHMTGLVFGMVTLTWVVSGLVSMNPWGFLEGRRGGGEQARVEGQAPKWSDVRTSLDAVRGQPSVVTAVSLATAPLAGHLYWLATQKDGTVTRLDAAGNVAAVKETDLAEAARRIAGAAGIAEQAMVGDEDAYYFRRRDSFVLPVYRVVLSDEGSTRYYLDPNTGALLQRADTNGRWHRWLFGGLHRIDFASWMRARPVWDIIVLILMLGGLGLTATGLYLAIQRVRNDFVVLSRFAARRGVAQQSAGVKIDPVDA